MENTEKQNRRILCLRDHPEWCERAAVWFHEKWGISLETYRESIHSCLQRPQSIPQWYIMLSDEDAIIGGVGAIQNDFHKRTDLTPNLCAVYVEESCRGCGAARALLEFACDDLAAIGIENVYLLTDHVGFYERCGWSFLCMAEENGGGWARVYHRALARPKPVTDGR